MKLSTIFSTIVLAAALLGATACGKKQAPATPKASSPEMKANDPMMKGDDSGKKPDNKVDPTKKPDGADPCAGGE
jgi:hypothetical protein